MQRCKIQITTATSGTVSRLAVEGKLQHTSNGFSVFYVQDGDEVAVEAQQDSFFMSRTGDTALNAHFIRGVQSVMRVGFQSSEGEIPLFTTDYSLRRNKSGFFVVLGYVLGDTQRFNLKISVLSISEDK